MDRYYEIYLNFLNKKKTKHDKFNVYYSTDKGFETGCIKRRKQRLG